MARRLVALAALLVAVRAAEFRKIHGDDPSIYDGQAVMSETDRVARFHELHGEWPDSRWLARETPGYTKVRANLFPLASGEGAHTPRARARVVPPPVAFFPKRMAEREADIMANATSSQARWDQWMFLVQARMLPTFTPTQWAHTKAPAHVHQRLYERFHERLATATRESMSQDLSGVHGPIHALFFEQARPPRAARLSSLARDRARRADTRARARARRRS